MHAAARRQLLVHVIGGVAVLVSYGVGLATHPETRTQLWGSIPVEVQGAYSACMPFAAVGYLVVMGFVLLRVPEKPALRGGYRSLTVAFAFLLACCAAWMPLSFASLDGMSGLLWPIQAVLAGTAGAALWLLSALWRLRPEGGSPWWWRLSVAGWLAFCWQTVVLDALIWPRFFPA